MCLKLPIYCRTRGEGKRKLGLGRIRARGAETSMSVIALQFLVMNLERRLRVLFLLFSDCLASEAYAERRLKVIMFSKP